MTVLLKDVAEQAQTSPGTVSRVLSGGKAALRISDATRKRILTAADTLGYKPNIVARSLRTKRTYTIGVIAHGEGDISRQLKAAEFCACQKGYELFLAISRWDTKREEDVVRRIMRRGIDGLLIISPVVEGTPDEILDDLVEKKFPLVGFGPTLAKGADFVDWDRVGAYHRLAEHLILQGCKMLAFWADPIITPGIQGRIDGINQAVAKMDNGVTLEIINTQPQAYRDDKSLLEFLKYELDRRQPHAVLCRSDDMAMAVSDAARCLGITLPSALAVTGCSNSAYSKYLEVPLTTVAMPFEKMIEVAIDRIVCRIEDPDRNFERMEEYIPADVLIRKSSLFGQAKS